MRRFAWKYPLAIAALLLAGSAAHAQSEKNSATGEFEWLQKPTAEDLAAVYPPRAYQEFKDGQAILKCKVAQDGSLTECHASERPMGYGFAAAAIWVSHWFRAPQKTSTGEPTAGKEVTIPLQWRMP